MSNEEKMDLMLDLIYAFGIVRKPAETAVFLQDLLTSNEIRNLSIRLRIAKLLLAGFTFTEIIHNLHVSSTTITKVSIWLEQGGVGFRNVISKLPVKWKRPKNLPRGPIEFHLPELLIALAEYKLSQKNLGVVRKFLSKIDDKKLSDKSLKEASDYLYRSKISKR